MRSIEQMYAEGDYAAIRQMLDEAEAKAEAKAKEAKAKEVAVARENLIEAAKAYTNALECPMDELSIVRLVKSLSSLEGLTKYGETPVIRVKTRMSDDDFLQDWLRGRGL